MNIPKSIQTIFNILNNSGFEAYLVGGCVRDYLMGITPHDFDLTTNALPDEMLKLFSDMRIIETGIKHGTVTVVSDGENVEITTFRIDGNYKDNRHPENVNFTRNLSEDLSRRDFTVNAIAYSPYTGFVDVFGGIDDIEKKNIRCVGEPDHRFNEDGLRIMRALRFSAVTMFDIDNETSLSIHKNLKLLSNISSERIYSELKKLLNGDDSGKILKEYADVFFYLFPAFNDNKYLYFENISRISSLPKDNILRFAALFNGFDNESVVRSLKFLKTDRNLYDNVLKLCSYLSEDINSDSVSVRYLMKSLNDNNIIKLAQLKAAFFPEFNKDGFIKEFNKQKADNACVRISQLMVDGNDVMSISLSGSDIGKALDMVLNAVIEDKCINEKDALITYIKNNFVW